MSGERGSIALFVLFVCLAVAVVVQSLSGVVMSADHAVLDERYGRTRMAEKDEGLAALRDELLSGWQVLPWHSVRQAPERVEGAVTDLPQSEGWAFIATTRQAADVSALTTSAWVERAGDGVDLPLAGLVASSVTAVGGRTSPWLRIEGGEEALHGAVGAPLRPTGCVVTEPSISGSGPGVTIATISRPWGLDGGWKQFFETEGEGIGLGPRVGVLAGGAGTTFRLPADWGGSAQDAGLIVVTGGAQLDARDRGDVYGVVVVDGGDVQLEGTRVHGAVLATGSVDVGSTGEVIFSRAVLRWATDQSLQRVRLVPGTRFENSG